MSSTTADPQQLAAALRVLFDLDKETRDTVLALYVSELSEAETSGVAEDEQVLAAIVRFSGEIGAQFGYEKDRRLAQSIVEAKLTDFGKILGVLKEEQEAQQDHELALRLDDQDDSDEELQADPNKPANPLPQHEGILEHSTPTISRLANLWISKDAAKALHPDNVEGHIETEPELEQALAAKIECIYCSLDLSYAEVIDVPCEHHYCKDCIQELFLQSFKDESAFPPKFCKQPIKIDNDMRIFFNKEFIDTYDEKEIEFSTTDKTYCAKKECSKFIPPSAISNDIGLCPSCDEYTCSMCKGDAHEIDDCPKDETLHSVLEVARKEGWQRCNRCQSMVELRIGCNHITCRYGNEFCYVCGNSPWKSCDCEQWEERRLYDDQQPPGDDWEPARPLDNGWDAPDPDAEPAADEVDNDDADGSEPSLECEHEWERSRGGICDRCSQHLARFLFECSECYMEVCRRCLDVIS